MKYFKIPSLEKHQHYTNRCPPWIKLHVEIFTDYNFTQLPDVQKAHVMLLWLLASRTDNKLPWDPGYIQKCTGMNSKIDLDALQGAGFIEMLQDDSDTLASCKQNGGTEERRGEESRGEYTSGQPDGSPNGVALADIKNIIAFLNSKTQRGFQATNPNGSITAGGVLAKNILKKGYSVQQIKTVIAYKCREWGPDDKMHKFLTPDTLFRPSKFEKYLGEVNGG